MQVCTACAVQADRVGGFDKRYVHFDTTSIMMSGEYLPPEEGKESASALRIPYGDSQDKRPDLKQLVFSTLCVDRAVPRWGKAHDGTASATTVKNTLLSDIATFLAQHGLAPGAYMYVADAALVTEEHLTAFGDTLCITRLPAAYHACGQRIAEAVVHNTWRDLGVIAHTKPTKHRPATSYKAYEGQSARSGAP